MTFRIVLGIAVVGLVAAGAFRSPVGAQATGSVWDGIYTEAQAKRGEAIYKAECMRCHGLELEGGEMGPPLSGPAFSSNWNGLTVGDLFDRIRVNMPMDKPVKLPRAQYADVLSFLLSQQGFPKGQADLKMQSEFLKQIKYETNKK
jgi:mono/diheme cytochrome c family protein